MISTIIFYRTSEWLEAMAPKPKVLMDVQSFMSSKRSGLEKAKSGTSHDTAKTVKTVDKNKTPETSQEKPTPKSPQKDNPKPTGTSANQPKGAWIPVVSTQPTDVSISRLPWIPILEGTNSTVSSWHLYHLVVCVNLWTSALSIHYQFARF